MMEDYQKKDNKEKECKRNIIKKKKNIKKL